MRNDRIMDWKNVDLGRDRPSLTTSKYHPSGSRAPGRGESRLVTRWRGRDGSVCRTRRAAVRRVGDHPVVVLRAP